MEYRKGLVNVENGSPTVTGDITAFESEVSPGDLFRVLNTGVTYEVSAVVSDTELTLSAPYSGLTASAVEYTITRDFTPNQGIPVPMKGDLEPIETLKQSLMQLDSLGAFAGAVEELTNVEIVDPSPGEALIWDGTKWINYMPGGGSPISGEYNAGNSGTSKTITWTNGQNQLVTMTGNCTVTFASPSNGVTYKLRIVQGGSGSYTVTWPTIKWAGGAAPTLSTDVGAIDIITLYYNGSTYFGMAGIGFA